MRNIDSFTEVISACRFCFMCRHLSAVGQVSFREADTPRGRALIADTIRMHPEKISDADFVDTVYRSDLSGANRFHCGRCHDGAGYDEIGLQLALRRDIVEAGREPEPVKKLADELEAAAEWRIEGSGDVLFLLDCCTQKIPEIASGFARLAGAGNIAYRTVAGGCIGKALGVLGYAARAQAVAKKFAALVNGLGARVLVVSNPAAFDALVHDYPKNGVELNVPVMHSSEFIANRKLNFRHSGREVCFLESDYLKNYGKNCPYPAELLRQLGVVVKPFGTNDEESYAAGEGALVLPRLYPQLARQLAGHVAARAGGELLVTASPYTRRLLAEAGANVLTLEELASDAL